ncbi:hypothetical protein LguiA_028110 [Lonicera macranthoides]
MRAFILFAFVACLGLVNWSRHKKTSVEDSPQLMEKKLNDESEIEEKISPALSNVEEEEKIKKIEYNDNLSSLLHSTEEIEASKEFSHSHVPPVKLLGELVIGEVSSSLRSCGVTHFSSYESSIAGKKITMKEEVKDGDVSMLITTPVRRSSRLYD